MRGERRLKGHDFLPGFSFRVMMAKVEKERPDSVAEMLFLGAAAVPHS